MTLGIFQFGALIEFFRQSFGDDVADTIHQILLEIGADLQQRRVDSAFDLRGETAFKLCGDAVVEFF